MPFWTCDACGERIYSATARPRRPECPACGHPLPVEPSDAPPSRDATDDGGETGEDATSSPSEERRHWSERSYRDGSAAGGAGERVPSREREQRAQRRQLGDSDHRGELSG